jgi:hypothetical protein
MFKAPFVVQARALTPTPLGIIFAVLANLVLIGGVV